MRHEHHRAITPGAHRLHEGMLVKSVHPAVQLWAHDQLDELKRRIEKGCHHDRREEDPKVPRASKHCGAQVEGEYRAKQGDQHGVNTAEFLPAETRTPRPVPSGRILRISPPERNAIQLPSFDQSNPPFSSASLAS